jgi:hypothetical protein
MKEHRKRPLADRFWEKVQKGTDSDCWPFIGTRNNKGYGMFQQKIDGAHGKRLAHRVSYELNIGPVPNGLFVLHRCDNPPCVNPRHLFIGDRSDNSRDMYSKGRWSMDPSKRVPPPRICGDKHHLRRHPEKVMRGELAKNAKLTDDLVRQYRAQLASGKALRQLARETGLARKTLMHMRDRVTWRHVL